MYAFRVLERWKKTMYRRECTNKNRKKRSASLVKYGGANMAKGKWQHYQREGIEPATHLGAYRSAPMASNKASQISQEYKYKYN
jgi:hypothetical protein